MTYAQGGNVSATEFNTLFLGSGSSQAVAYPSLAATAKKLAAVLGVGYGSCGWGSVASPLVPVPTNNPVDDVHWNTVIGKLASARSFLGHSVPANPANVAEGSTIAYLSTLQGMLDAVYDQRLAPAAGNMSTALGNAAASGQWATSRDTTINVSFATEDEARYFFNRGGKIHLSISHGGATGLPQDQSWLNEVVNGFGTLSIGADSIAMTGNRTGAMSVPAGGYYGLTPETTYTLFNDTTFGAGVYSGATMLVTLVASTVGGSVSNGSKGRLIQIRTYMTDPHTNPYTDYVSNGMSNNVYITKAAAVFPHAGPNVAIQVNSWS